MENYKTRPTLSQWN